MAKILVVDDDTKIQMVVKIMLQKSGYEVRCVSSGLEAFQALAEYRPDMILLDVMMPGYTTKETLQKLIEKGHKDVKIILVTVVRFSDEEKENLMSSFNIVDYVPKPFDPINLINTVKEHLTGE